MTTNKNADSYWKYMRRTHAACPEYINEDCSKTAHKDLGLDWSKTQ